MNQVISVAEMAKKLGLTQEEFEKKMEATKATQKDIGQMVAKIKLIHGGVVKKFNETHIEYIVLIDPKNPKVKIKLGNLGAYEGIKINSKRTD